MRWSGQLATPAEGQLTLPGAVIRTFDTPAFRGMTFYEVHARTILNRVPDQSQVPFRWTINPYRGCSHACVYCFARGTHTYLGLDAGLDFERRLVVKVNAAELLRKELAGPKWGGEHIAMGTNVDCYQRVEGRYRLMRGILSALRDRANPYSILTKGTLILRDLDLLEESAGVTDVSTAVSVGSVEDALWRALEPGTPHPRRRLEVCRRLADRGIAVSVLMAPIVPHLSDSPEQLERCLRQIAAAGAGSVSPIVLHLRPGAREWFAQWLAREHPGLRGAYRSLYRGGSYADAAYRQRIGAQVAEIASGLGLRTPGAGRFARRPVGEPAAPAGAGQRPAAAEGAQLALI